MAKAVEFADQIAHNNLNLEELHVSAEESSVKTEVGNKDIEKTVSSLQEISQEVKETVKAIGELDRNSKEIAQIVGLITNIAEQTNLLES